MRYVIVGGVAGGRGAAARLRRLDEEAEIIMLEKGEFISFANCGLPYYLSGVIADKEKLLVQTPQSFTGRFNVDVRIFSEVVSVDGANKTVHVKNHKDGTEYDLSCASSGGDYICISQYCIGCLLCNGKYRKYRCGAGSAENGNQRRYADFHTEKYPGHLCDKGLS